ncbi:MAG TPA: hypothetical protein PLB49_05050 [Chitinophagaceae bacterium]|mgnify:CR=1 FL=1|nr:hypothetical protein [Chitinophagaceae bacterium]HPH31192.1 hypothetical protein [Chitinophagaceae bacterium]
MVRLKSTADYWLRLAGFIFFLLVLFFLSVTPFSPFASWKPVAVFSFILLLIFVSQKRVILIIADTGYLTIQYYRMCIKWTFKGKRDGVKLSVLQKTTFRGGKYRILQVVNNGKLLFEIDERDGFIGDDFNELLINSEGS